MEVMTGKKYKSKPNSYVYLDTPCGKIKGIRKPDHLLFKGVRYASAGRFEDPEAVTSWQGEYDATKPGAACCQHAAFFSGAQTKYFRFYYNQPAEKSVFHYSEDCLNLNIWAPEGAKDAPVAVFIHGGSYQSGSNGMSYVVGDEYVRRGIVFVSINYRLNAFASAFDGKHRGNCALKDQIAALRWIRSNIAAFGGNPDHIVTIGESAGASSLQCHLYSPAARGLSAGSILMSGGGWLDTLRLPDDPQCDRRIWDIVKKRYGAGSVSELVPVDAKELYTAWTQAVASEPGLLPGGRPVVDGSLIPKTVPELLEAGEVSGIPLIIGLSSEDIFPWLLYTKAIEWADIQNKINGAPVYGYYLDRQPPGEDHPGAYHGIDLWYAFGTLDLNWRPFEETDYRISDNMIDYFASFIRDCNPGRGIHGDLSEWTPLEAACPRFIHFGDDEPAMFAPPEERLKNAVQNTNPFPEMDEGGEGTG